jgi:hypothetical protein
MRNKFGKNDEFGCDYLDNGVRNLPRLRIKDLSITLPDGKGKSSTLWMNEDYPKPVKISKKAAELLIALGIAWGN